MNRLPRAQVELLKALLDLWGPERFIVIGASAVALHIGLRWRITRDLDLSVLCGPDEYAPGLERLGWRREPRAPQRWRLADGSIVDVIPGSPDLVTAGEFVWPGGDSRMRLVGFRLAFADAQGVEIDAGAIVRVASLRSLAVLKMSSYLDHPWDRESDLADLAHIMAMFVDVDADERWSEEVLELGLEFEDVSPFLLGRELRPLVDEPERSLVRGFIAAVENRNDPLSTVARMARRAPTPWNEPAELEKRMVAFVRGFEPKG